MKCLKSVTAHAGMQKGWVCHMGAAAWPLRDACFEGGSKLKLGFSGLTHAEHPLP